MEKIRVKISNPKTKLQNTSCNFYFYRSFSITVCLIYFFQTTHHLQQTKNQNQCNLILMRNLQMRPPNILHNISCNSQEWFKSQVFYIFLPPQQLPGWNCNPINKNDCLSGILNISPVYTSPKEHNSKYYTIYFYQPTTN